MENKNCFVIVCHDVNVKLGQWKDAQFIGVETGTLKLINEQRNIVLACADFDHTTNDELNFIKQKVDNVIILPTQKDILDSEFAILQAIERGATKLILIVSGYRWGMLFGLIALLVRYQDYELEIYDENNILYLIKGKFQFKKSKYKDYHYFDFLPLVETKLNLTGFKYLLTTKRNLLPYDNYFISNEINKTTANIDVIEGYGILTISKKIKVGNLK